MTGLTRHVAGSLRTAAIICGLLITGFVLTLLVLDGKDPAPSPGDVAQRTTEPAPGSPAALLEEHDCWTGEAPADMEGKVPGHVVVTEAGRSVPTYGGSRLVGLALDQVFGEADNGLTVHGFCR